ncbi:hypothetical protein BRADI_1g58953v3 [Brachypodium distachyon]|uniref:Uncharacterized protein n=1 Tax=Brachypodium distachyon TaxID=15368 RepID=A0A0Q3HF36_BRADI|nr:hypothetical protein BRADI_1g58953v3 [Brachypodium distachyon]
MLISPSALPISHPVYLLHEQPYLLPHQRHCPSSLTVIPSPPPTPAAGDDRARMEEQQRRRVRISPSLSFFSSKSHFLSRRFLGWWPARRAILASNKLAGLFDLPTRSLLDQRLEDKRLAGPGAAAARGAWRSS